MKAITVTVVGLCAVLSVSAQNWPGFRGAAANGVAAEAAPARWDVAASQNILWKAPVPGLAHASPVIWGDRVFIVTAIASEGAPTVKVGSVTLTPTGQGSGMLGLPGDFTPP